VDGQQLSVNDDFATQVIYLARVLSCSERYIAGLMQYVISNNPNFNPVNILERVVLEHHRRRRDLADCIRFLLEAAEIVGSPGTTALHARLELFVTQQLIPSKEGTDSVVFGEKGWGWKVLLEVEALDQSISQALAAKQNAGSNTTLQGLLSSILTILCLLIYHLLRCQLKPGIRYTFHARRITDPRASRSCHDTLSYRSSGLLVPPRNRKISPLVAREPTTPNLILHALFVARRI
jgi:hypothetical protein